MKKNTKKERFLEVALQLIHLKGFKATTLRDIAQALNFEVANVYNYIDSKQSLLEVYLFNIQDEFHDSIDSVIASSYSPKEKLRLVISSYIQITAKRPLVQALIANEWRNLKEPKLQEFIDRRSDYEKKLNSIIQEGVTKGEFREIDVDITTHIIMSSLRWLYVKYINPPTKINTIEIEKQMTDFIQNAITKK
jgi:AcrR family transcriptional regulator